MTVQNLRFVALGDSTTVGIGDPVGAGWRGWSRLLADELAASHRLAYANLAVSGATAASVRATQLPRAVSLKPQLASVVVGVNDTMRSSWDPVRVRDDILTCVGGLAGAGALVMTLRFHDHGGVLGLPALLRRPLWRRIEVVNAAYDEAYAAYGGIRLDLTSEPAVYERPFWSIDRLHPSELGHRRLASAFALALQAHGYSLACPSARGMVSRRGGQEWWWLASEGLPWLARRANDLVPWAIRMITVETIGRTRAAHAGLDDDAPSLRTQMTSDTPPQAMPASPRVHPARSG